MAGESKLEKEVTTWAKARGILTYKFVSPGTAGVPDRIFLYRGRTVFIELKDKKKKPEPLQLREMTILTAAGFPASWSDDAQFVKDFLTHHLLDRA